MIAKNKYGLKGRENINFIGTYVYFEIHVVSCEAPNEEHRTNLMLKDFWHKPLKRCVGVFQENVLPKHGALPKI